MWCAHRFVGVALSTVDMVTDVQVIVEYLNTPGKEAYAYPLMGMVGTCLFLQLLIVWGQTRKASRAKRAKEMLIVLSGLKPGFDAYQVAKGTDQRAGAIFNPSLEHIFTKGVEMVAESIPGACFPTHTCLSGAPSLTFFAHPRLYLAVLRAPEDADEHGWRKHEFHHQPSDLGAVNGVQLRNHHVGLRHQHNTQARRVRVLRHDP
jgi:hypothetical protein